MFPSRISLAETKFVAPVALVITAVDAAAAIKIAIMLKVRADLFFETISMIQSLLVDLEAWQYLLPAQESGRIFLFGSSYLESRQKHRSLGL